MTNKETKYDKFLNKYKVGKGQLFTHTRIGNPSLGVFAGSYFIPENEYTKFYKLYVKHVFTEGKQEYLTEKQLEEGPLVIDIDFRYSPDIEDRQHTNDDTLEFIDKLFDKLTKIFQIKENNEIMVYIFEKDNVNCLEDVTKDGIHIMTNIKMDVTSKTLLRNMLLEELPKIWNEIPVINSWDEVLDIAVIRGTNNWQMVGSRKPGNEEYKLINYYKSTYLNHTEGWNIEEINKEFNYVEDYNQLSCRTMEMIHFNFNPNIKPQYDVIFNSKKKKSFAKKINKSKQLKNISDIENEEDLDELINNMLDENDTKITDIHKYTMILPESFYNPGSFNNWIRTGWALKNTSEKLLLTWIKFSLQSVAADFSDITDLIDKWEMFDKYNSDGLTGKSIRFWAYQNNKEEYLKIRKSTIEHYVEETYYHNQEYDLAVVLHELYKDRFVCVSPSSNAWYEFIEHRWLPAECGTTLRLKISTELCNYYIEKVKELDQKIYNLNNNETLVNQVANISNFAVATAGGDKNKKETGNPVIDKLKARRDVFNEIACKKLRSTTWKNNIMKEAKDKFYDKNFLNKMDKNVYLTCFNNCVIDFKNGEIRNGRPDDYITKCTNTNYIKDKEMCNKKYNEIKTEIETFMKQLFPNDNLRNYMWNHLASSLLGTTHNQTFNIFNGSGANGKSILIDLMGKILGEYKGVVPLTLITQRRNAVGGTSSEVAQLIGVRYAVMQEPSKNEQMNEGIMKELTGGDPIQCRQLFKESQTFIPQFKLVVCTNCLFDIKSQDDGTWRRLRLVDFVSKFTENPNTPENPKNNRKFPLTNYPYQFEVDRNLDRKFSDWAPVFTKELVKIAMKTKGRVEDCYEVIHKTDEYRKDKDVFNEFAGENIIDEENNNITKTNLRETFKNWYEDKYDKKNMPQGKELYSWMDNRYGKSKAVVGWSNIALVSNIFMN